MELPVDQLGRVHLPMKYLEAIGLHNNCVLEAALSDNAIVLRKVNPLILVPFGNSPENS